MQVKAFASRLLPLALVTGAAAFLTVSMPSFAQQPAPAGSGAPAGGGALPSAQNAGGQVTTITVQGGSRALFKIAVAPPLGDATIADQVVKTATNDFTLSSMFQVLDPKSFTANLSQEGMTIEPASWRNVGAEGVVKGTTQNRGSTVHVELRLFVVSRGATEVLKKEYDVAPGAIRSAVHQFDNEVVKWFTGTAGSFGGRLVFSATTGRGQKGIFSIESDGQGLGRLNAATNVALAPAAGPGGVYYAGGLPDGSYQLFKVGNPTAVLKHAGLGFGVAFGG